MITFATMKEQDSNSPIIHLQQQQLLLRMEYEYEKRNSNAKPKHGDCPESETGTLLVSCHSGTKLL